MAWCKKFEMDAATCAHCLGHTGKPDKVPAAGPDFPSKHPGVCGHCGEWFDRESTVCAAIVDGERAWVLSEHTTR